MQPEKKIVFYFTRLIISNQKLTLLSCLALITYLIFCWTYHLGISPGLHGDEAWFGLEGGNMLKHPTNKLTGMNYYTGILQSLVASLFFSLSGATVFNLRIGGVILNLLGLLIIWRTLYTKASPGQSLIFLLVICQSGLYLNSPRVGWEVNTFTLFFSSLILVSITRSIEKQKMSKYLIFFTLLVFVVGSYNHIIFSAVPVSLIFGFGFTYLFHRKSIYFELFILMVVAVIDCLIQLLLFKHDTPGLFSSVWYYPVAAIVLLLAQTFMLDSCIFRLIPSITIKLNKNYFIFALPIALIPFVFFHGKAFFETLSNYKIYMQFYSFESALWSVLIFSGIAAIVVLYLVMNFRRNFLNEQTLLFTIAVASYAIIFSAYTTLNSYRYYLELYLAVALFLAVTASDRRQGKWRWVLMLSLSISLLTGFYTQFQIFCSSEHSRALYFEIGNNQQETSAHFLPKERLIQFLESNQIDSVIILGPAPYFLETPVNFYKQSAPWKSTFGKKAVIMYQSTNRKKDGILFFKED